MTTVFVDTGGFYAQLDARDAHHSRAADVFRQAQAERWALVTTNAVVYETHTLFDRHFREYGRWALL